MKFRITPLNILTSFLLVGSVYLIIFADKEGWRFLGTIPLLVIAVISFVTDLIFRRTLRNLKRIWIVEMLFVIFVVLIMLIIQRF
jgi:hypothetical protein